MSGAALELCSLRKSYPGGPLALDDVDLVLAPGEVQALVGLNGAGKTSLLRVALGMTRADAGAVSVLGRSLAQGPDWSQVGHLVETPGDYGELTVRENLWVAALLHGLPPRRASGEVQRVLEELDLGRLADRRARTLSQGNHQRLALGRATVHRPLLLVLDEPTNALDPSAIVLLRDRVRALTAAGTAVLVSSHHLDEIARVADAVTVIHAGRVVGSLEPDGSDLERRFFAMVHRADQERPHQDETPARVRRWGLLGSGAGR